MRPLRSILCLFLLWIIPFTISIQLNDDLNALEMSKNQTLAYVF